MYKLLATKFILLIGILDISLVYSANDPILSFVDGKKVGIISMFTGEYGIGDFNKKNRAILLKGGKDYEYIYPDSSVSFDINVNQDITSHLKYSLQEKFTESTFIELPTISIEKNLTGYLIPGIWGLEANSVTVKGLNRFFNEHNLDHVLGVVRVMYYIPSAKTEGYGMEMIFRGKNLFFGVSYAMVLFSKNGNSYEKSYWSIKQVFEHSARNKSVVCENMNSYNKFHAQQYYDIFRTEFLPYLENQVIRFLENPQDKNIFPIPKKPLKYLMPH